jgi:predicted TIM-barrel fold metal-dependent hydrolase
LIERCSSQGWSIGLHDDAVRLPGILDRIGDRAPKLVIDHFCRPESYGSNLDQPEYRSLLRRLVTLRASVKISAAYRSPGIDVAKAIGLLQAELGEDKLLWGSDWPWTQHELGRDYLEWSGADGRPTPLAQRFTRNAERFYNF